MFWSNVSGAFSLLWPEKSDRKCWQDRGLLELTAEKKKLSNFIYQYCRLWGAKVMTVGLGLNSRP